MGRDFVRIGKSRQRRGLKHRPNEQAREQYIAEVNPLIKELGLQEALGLTTRARL